VALGLDEPADRLGLADVLADAKPLGLAVTAGPWDFDVLTGSPRLGAIERSADQTDVANLAEALDETGFYDLVLLDCPPSLGHLTFSALVASDTVVIVTDPSLLAAAGLRRMLSTVTRTRRLHPQLRLGGVIVNRVRNTNDHRTGLAQIRDALPDHVLEPPMPLRAGTEAALRELTRFTALRGPGATTATILGTYLDHLNVKGDT
jgi:cellulose biosynthesis protein BcsQ